MILISHPTGNSNVRALLNAFEKSHVLGEFFTTISYQTSFISNFIPKNINLQFERRSFSLLSKSVNTDPFPEMLRLLLTKYTHKFPSKFLKELIDVDYIYRRVDKRLSTRIFSCKGDIKAVYAYEDGALQSFQAAKSKGLFTIYDLPIAYWEYAYTLYREEAIRLPDWALTLGGGIFDSDEKLERKRQELALADMIIVPSNFVHNSLPLWTNNKNIVFSPFGGPVNMPVIELDISVSRKAEMNNLRVLFVGSLGQRKGLSDLISAVKMLKTRKIELVLLGSLQAPLDFYKREFPDLIYESPRPNKDVLELMRSCDVFCLPSIVEGRALVVQEAMSQGLPIIITPNTGCEDLVIEGETGFLVPIRSPHSIAEKLNWFLVNRSLIPEMGIKAQKHASNYTWDEYGKRIVNAISAYFKF
jgi:glycosyltransferase involved in cell wall biosynthesis